MDKIKNFVVPNGMKGTFSRSEFAEALGIKPEKQRPGKAMKCIKCGKPMRQVIGTNVWICDGQVEQEKDGVKKLVPCGHRAVTSINPATHKAGDGLDDRQGKKPYKGKHISKADKSAEG